MIPGNHDSRNVGYVHFEELFGERNSVMRKGGVTVVAVDSTEPDLDHGQIGRGRYPWIEEQFAGPADLRVFVCHHHLLPVPGTGRERNVIYDAGDTIECLQRAGRRPRPLGPQARARTRGGSRTSSSSTRARSRRSACAATCGPVTTWSRSTGTHVDVFRRYPFHGQERIIQFSTETRAFEKYTARIDGEVTTRT